MVCGNSHDRNNMQNPLKSKKEGSDNDSQKPLHRAMEMSAKKQEKSYFSSRPDGDDGPRAGAQLW